MKDIFGIVFSNMHDHTVRELTANRCMGSLPVGGRYRLIDFVLSGFSNADITNTAVIAKSNYKSLLDHLGNGREWDLARKRGGLVILPPAAITENGTTYQNRVEALAGIMSIIQDNAADYVLCADCDLMANIDYDAFARFHKESGADITLMYKKQYFDGKPDRDMVTFGIGEGSRVTEIFINPEATGEQNEYLNIMIMSKGLLEWIVQDCRARGLDSFVRDALQANVGKFRINAFEFSDSAYRFDSMKAYFDSNLALLDPRIRKAMFRSDRPVYTRVFDEPPVRYGLNAKVENSLIADGCLIEGEVENCLLFRGVTVSRGAKVRNCVLMQGSQVGRYSELDHIVTDRVVFIKDNRTIIGHESYPIYIKKGSVV